MSDESIVSGANKYLRQETIDLVSGVIIPNMKREEKKQNIYFVDAVHEAIKTLIENRNWKEVQ